MQEAFMNVSSDTIYKKSPGRDEPGKGEMAYVENL